MIIEFLSAYIVFFHSRLRILVIYTWPLFVGMVVALKSIPNVILIIESMISISAISFAVYVYNDIQDIKEDTANAKLGNQYHIDRPLIKGIVNREHAISFVLVMIAIGLGTSFFVNLEFLILISLCLILGLIYSSPPIYLKKRFPLKQFTIASGVAIAILAGGTAVGDISKPVIYLAALFFIIYFGVNPIIDIRDLYGDYIGGRKTLPMIVGPKRTVTIGFISMISVTIISMISHAWIGFNFIFPILAGSAFLSLTFYVYKVFQNFEKPCYIEKVFVKKFLTMFFFLQIVIIISIFPF